MTKAKELFDFRKETHPKGVHLSNYKICGWTTFKRHKEFKLTPITAVNLRYIKPEFRGKIFLFKTHIAGLNDGLVWAYRKGNYVFYVAPYLSDKKDETML